MDAAIRVELAGLRRRAYGPTADIDGDAEALVRLAELEDLVLRDRAVPPPVPPRIPAPAPAPARAAPVQGAPPRAASVAGPASPPEPSLAPAPAEPRPGHPEPPPAPRPAAGRRGRPTLAIVGAALALALTVIVGIRLISAPPETPEVRSTLSPAFQASRAAYSFARDGDATTLLNIPLDGSFGGFIDLPSDGHVPEFPTAGEVEWAVHIGEYFGWEVWIAGAMVDTAGLRRDHCLLVERGQVTRGRCVPASIRSQSALLVDVPFTFITDADRPVGMEEGERLGFWWRRDQAVTVLLGDDPLR
ncbi:hypothetical protein [Microbacterium flavescens]|uniref:hypothetical protein n=1 Tax=Microbacterium flavescens TaxID=69366 RepID=UPI001FE98902|nr:hypothetical protein [Microbacterium flavescens]